MPYSIKTGDNITITDIPDDIDPNAQELQDRVAKIRADRYAETRPDLQAETDAAQQESSSADRIYGAINRGIAPIASGAALGAIAGAPIGGVGAIGGAAAGAGAAGLATLIGDPLVGAINSLTGSNFTEPSAAWENLLTSLGVPEPKTQAEKIIKAATQGLAETAGGIGLGKTLANFGKSAVTQNVGKELADNVPQNLAAGALSGAGAEAGGQYGGTGGAVAGALLGGSLTSVSRGATTKIQDQNSKEFADVGSLINKASSGGIGANKARTQIASIARPSQETISAQDAIGADLPIDILSDSAAIKSAAGLARSVAGSVDERNFYDTISDTATKADQALRDMGAVFVSGAPSLSEVSKSTLDSLKSSQKELQNSALPIFNKINTMIPKKSKIQLNNLYNYLNQKKEDVTDFGLDKQEKFLLDAIQGNNVTYGFLQEVKNNLSNVWSVKDSPYSSMDKASRDALWSAISKDQIENVQQKLGQNYANELKIAIGLTKKRKDIEELIVDNFGKDFNGSIAQLLRSSIQSASKGDISKLNELISIIPNGLQKNAVATALADVARSAAQKGMRDDNFGFSEFVKTFSGIKSNPDAYKILNKTLGADSMARLDSVLNISKRITDARARVLKTGKANQALVGALHADGIVGKILSSSFAQRATVGVIGAMAPGVGAFFAQDIHGFIKSLQKDPVKSASKLFNDPEFQKMTQDIVTGKLKNIEKSSIINNKNYIDFLKKINVQPTRPNRVQFLYSAMQASGQQQDSSK